MKSCTWVGCKEIGRYSKKSNDGQEWALLCESHHKQFEDSENEFLSGDKGPGGILSGWVKAQGGAKAAAARMMK